MDIPCSWTEKCNFNFIWMLIFPKLIYRFSWVSFTILKGFFIAGTWQVHSKIYMEEQGPRLRESYNRGGQSGKINCGIVSGSLYTKEKECPTAVHVHLNKSQKRNIEWKGKSQKNKHGMVPFTWNSNTCKTNTNLGNTTTRQSKGMIQTAPCFLHPGRAQRGLQRNWSLFLKWGEGGNLFYKYFLASPYYLIKTIESRGRNKKSASASVQHQVPGTPHS